MIKGRLGLDTARIPYKDRHGLLWLRYGHLTVVDGTLRWTKAPENGVSETIFDIPFQMLSCIVLGPGSMVSHDAMRLCARHGTGIIAVGDDGVRMYASMPFGPDQSSLARTQVAFWSDSMRRLAIVRRLYAWRLGDVDPASDLNTLRGMEGVRSKELYRLLANQYRVEWTGRHYDRSDPSKNNPVNNAINHASIAVIAAAQLAVAATATIPQLGFIHEDSGIAFALDIADVFRDNVTLRGAFGAVALWQKERGDLERVVRRHVGNILREQEIVSSMIDKIKELFDV